MVFSCPVGAAGNPGGTGFFCQKRSPITPPPPLLLLGLIIKLEKCLFGLKSLAFLGHQISQFGSTPLPSRVKAIEDFPKPSTVKGIQEFLGMINFYHRFIPHAASLLLPLHCALQKSTPRQVLSWTAEMDNAFTSIKAALS